GPITPAVLRRASYHGRPGHPVLLGADHWAPAVEQAHGDGGARHYMAAQAPTEVEVGDLATGDDVDTPQQRRRFETRWLG
ncbi:MAG TPA: nucleotidyltransferase family protein, partial [Beutenbergiaceae bacterium]|nr:nucleotidyltransferase family protein [Beutenbergiaceae bacterium]